ncbi:MAG: hypothetical protein IJK67_03830 [Bacilli bacterium]|nr:hypothetical protein [Bacilli bacterium]
MKKNEDLNQKNLKGISKAIAIISKILEVCMIIGASACLVATIAIPFILKNIKVGETDISYGKIKIAEISKDTLLDNGIDESKFTYIKDFITGNRVFELCAYTFICVVALVGLAFFFHYLYKLFKNISKEDTPFTEENVNLITKLLIALIGYIALPTILAWIAEIIGNIDINYSWGLKDIMLLLVIFASRHIFAYGCSLEKK